MTSPKSVFEFSDRGFDETILLIPGWATDHRVFSTIDVAFNILTPVVFSPRDFVTDCIKVLDKEKLSKVSVLGWSMGGYAASDLVTEHADRVRDLVLVGMRDAYDAGELSVIRSYLAKTAKAYLRKFYNECFAENELSAAWFKENLFKAYLREMEGAYLLDGIDYLSGARLDTQSLRNADVTFVYGSADKIAPVENVSKIRQVLPDATYVCIDGAGHMPFLDKRFKELVYAG